MNTEGTGQGMEGLKPGPEPCACKLERRIQNVNESYIR